MYVEWLTGRVVSVLHYLLELTTGELAFFLYADRQAVTSFVRRARCGPALLSRPALPSHTTVTFAPRRVVVHREDDPPPAVPRGRGELQLCKHPNRATCRIRLSPRKSPVTARQVSLRTPSPATRAHGDVSVFSEKYFLDRHRGHNHQRKPRSAWSLKVFVVRRSTRGHGQ